MEGPGEAWVSLCDLKRSPLTPAWPGGAGSEGSVLKQWGTRAVSRPSSWVDRIWGEGVDGAAEKL